MYLKIGLSLILLGILVFIVNQAIEVKNLPAIILNFPKEQLLLLVAISLTISVLKAWRFLILLKNSDINITFIQTLKAFMASQAISPLPGGESVRGILIHKETGEKLHKTAGPVITQAYLELLSATFLALIGSLVFSFLRIPIFSFLILMLLLAFIINSKKALKLLRKKLSKAIIFNKILDKLIEAQKSIRNNFIDEDTNLPDKVLVQSFALSLLTNILGGCLILLIAKYYGINLNIFQSIFINSASIIIQGLGTISPGGLGFTEGGMTGILLTYQVPLSKAIAIVLLYRLMTLILSIFLGLIFLLIFYSRSLLFKKALR